MLFILRQLRRLELRKRSGQYFVYAIGEIFLVVIGILLALQINNWNQARIDRASEQFYLQQLLGELESDRPSLQKDFDGLQAKPAVIKTFLAELDRENNREAFNLAFEDYINTVLSVPYFRPNSSTFDELKSNGKLEIIQDRDLRNQVVRFYNDYEELSRISEININFITSMDIDLSYNFGAAKFIREQRSVFNERISPEDIYKLKSSRQVLENHAANQHWVAVDMAPAFEKQIRFLDDLISQIKLELGK